MSAVWPAVPRRNTTGHTSRANNSAVNPTPATTAGELRIEDGAAPVKMLQHFATVIMCPGWRPGWRRCPARIPPRPAAHCSARPPQCRHRPGPLRTTGKNKPNPPSRNINNKSEYKAGSPQFSCGGGSEKG